MVCGQHEQVVLAQSRQDRREARVELLEVPGVTRYVVAVSVAEGIYMVVAFNFVRAPRPDPDTAEIALGNLVDLPFCAGLIRLLACWTITFP